MPNWVSNKVTIRAASKERLQEVRSLLETSNQDAKGGCYVDRFDFNKVLPMPPELKVTAGPENQYLEAWYGIKGRFPLTRSRIREIKREPDSQKLAAAYKSNLDKHGHATWYTWCTEHWGTKWPANCSEASVAEDGLSALYVFDTAWSVPLPVYVRLSELFPEISLHVEVDEEGGYFWGSLTLQNGVLGEDIMEGYRPGGPFTREDEEGEVEDAE